MIANLERQNKKGQAIVEFAIVFPLLLIVLFGVFEFSRIMFAFSTAVSASREAARYGAAIQDTGGGIPQYEDCTGIRDAAKRLGRYAGIEDANITIQYSNDGGIYSNVCPPTQEVGATDTISVTIDTTITPVTPVGNFSAIPINSSSSRTILKKVKLGFSGIGAGSVAGELSDVNFQTTAQTAEETAGTISVLLELNQVATDLVTIPFSVTGTATEGAGQDYLMTSSPVLINPGETTATLYISLNNDGLAEGAESLVIGIDTPINATKGPQNIHIVTIIDPPKVSFSTGSSVKLESTTTTALMLELSKASLHDVSIPITTSGSATWSVSGDYTTSPSSVVIPSGSLSGMLLITINNDAIDEYDEAAVINLGTPDHALLGSISTHTMTIVDDDDPPIVSFFTPSQVVSEEIGVFTTSITLSEVSGKTITIPYSTSGTTIPEDYLIHNPSPLTIPPGSKTIDINMSILEGDGWEEDETLILTLGTPTNAVVGSPGSQTIVITETSTEPYVSFAFTNQSLLEGNQLLDIAVQLSNAWSADVVIPFSLSGSAENGSEGDYVSSSSPLVIPVGWTQGEIQIQVMDDEIDENNEQLIITLGDIVNGILGTPSVHTINITDNDSPPEVNFTQSHSDVTEDTGTVLISVSLSAPSVNDVSVPLNLSGSAVQGGDYSISTTNLVITPGSSSGEFAITVIDDSVYDPDERIVVDLGVPSNAYLGSDTRYTLDIEDNELPPCEVGSHLLTIGTDSISLSMVNEGENVIFTGGSISWPEASPNQPRLTEINFSGTVVFSGNEKPTYYSYFTWEDFYSLATEPISYQFDSGLGSGDYTLVGNFQNPVSGTTCTLTESFTNH